MPHRPTADRRRLAFWMAYTLKKEREAANVERRDIARTIGLSERRIYNIEIGETLGTGYDEIIAAYGYHLGLDDSRELWDKALENWRRHGAAPTFSPESPPEAFERWIRETAQRQRQSRIENEEKPDATPNQQEAE